MYLTEINNLEFFKKEFEKIYSQIDKPLQSFNNNWNTLQQKLALIPEDKIINLINIFTKNKLSDLMLKLDIIQTNKGKIVSFRGIEFYLSKYDNIYFLKNYVKIKNPNPKYTDLIPFNLYEPQERIIKLLKEYQYLIIRKSRQIGFSTIFAGICLHQMNFFKAREFPILSKNEEEAMGFKEKVQIMYDSIPYWLKTKSVKANEHELKLVNYSSLQALSSSKEKGRSKSATILIIDEAAFIQYIETIWKAAFPVISQSHGKAVVISTTNGTGNWYYKTWIDAVNKKNNFYPVFIEWWEVPERDNEWLEQYRKGDLSFLPEGMDFRTFIKKLENFEIKNKWLEEQKKQLGDRGFRQEVLGEFITLGKTVVSHEKIMELESKKLLPIAKDFMNIENLWIFDLPKQNNKYVLLADVGTGRSEDFSAFHIINIFTKKQVAEYKNILDTYEFAKIIKKIATFYNKAVVIIESNGIGLSTLTHLLNENDKETFYEETYYENVKEGVRAVERNEKNRERHIDHIITKLFTLKEIFTFSERLVEEFKTFIWVKRGISVKARHADGAHDDLIMALSLWVFFEEHLIYRYIDTEMVFTDDKEVNYDLKNNMVDLITTQEDSYDNYLYEQIIEMVNNDETKAKMIMKNINKSL